MMLLRFGYMNIGGILFISRRVYYNRDITVNFLTENL